MKELIEKAISARETAYAPYSHFKVGAALLTADGHIYTGCNIENISYPVGICAERVAMSQAAANGERKFIAMAIAGGKDSYCFPCGMCRQFMAEFCDECFDVILVRSLDDYQYLSFKELMPYTFSF